jgi:hypothetical protein
MSHRSGGKLARRTRHNPALGIRPVKRSLSTGKPARSPPKLTYQFPSAINRPEVVAQLVMLRMM